MNFSTPATAYTKPSHFALLVGINSYPDPRDRLLGSVRDVQDIKSFLATHLEGAQVETFTATQSNDCTAFKPIEDPSCWPTYDNINSALEKILSIAEPGNFVYLHFSVHGTNKAGLTENSEHGENTKPFGLSLLSGELAPQPPIRYLWGRELAYFLRRMVDNDLIVTLALDCCFSGSVTRSDRTVRFQPYDAEVDAAFQIDPSKSLLQSDDVCSSPFRRASMLPNWLANPAGYSILTACGPTQKAQELSDENNLRHGVLSYYLHRGCTKFGGPGCNMGILYQYVCASIREKPLPQTPGLAGNRDLGFFGAVPDQRSLVGHVSTIRGSENAIRLPIGEAQGVCEGDLFNLWPLNAHSEETKKTRIGCVSRVSPLGCILTPYDSRRSFHVRTGWLAKPRTRIALHNYPVRISPDTPHGDAIEKALCGLGISVCHFSAEEFQVPSYLVHYNGALYEILDGIDRRVPNVPEISTTRTNAENVGRVIEHLLRYQLAKDLKNTDPSYRVSQYGVQMESGGAVFEADRLINLTHEDDMFLSVSNNGDKDLYLYIYGMGPFWEVEGMSTKSHTVVSPYSKKVRRITMTVAPELSATGVTVSEDIIKVFITTRWTSFDILILPELGKAKEIKIQDVGVKRGPDDASVEAWDTFNFPIHITKDSL